MRANRTIFVISICITLLTVKSAYAAINQMPGIVIKARAAELIEPSTQTVLYSFNPSLRIPPASLTKIMTLFITFEAIENGSIHLNDKVWISKRAWKTGGSKMFVEVGTRVPLQELIKGIAVASGNDACVAVAEHVAGSVEAFVAMMNEKAKTLGLKNTHFVNPHGLDDPDQYTTVEDIAKLASIYIKRFPQALKYHSTVEFTYNGIKQFNRNKLLLRDPTIDGLKTGFVSRGGYHLVATAKRNGMRLIAVVMGAKTPSLRLNETYKLLNYGFRNYTIVNPLDPNKPVTSVKVWKSSISEVKLYPKLVKPVVLSRKTVQSVSRKLEIPPEIVAPVRKNTVVGYMKVYANNKLIQTIPLIIKKNIDKASWYRCFYQTIKRKLSTKLGDFHPRSFLVLTASGITVLLVLLMLVRRNRRKRKYKSITTIRRF